MDVSRTSFKDCPIPLLLVHLFVTVSWSQVYLMMTFRHSLLLLVGVLSIVPVFCGLVGRGCLGRVRHCGEVVSHRDASGHDALHGCRKSSRGHAHEAGRVSRAQREGGR